MVFDKVDGKSVEPDDKEAVVTQAEHGIKLAVQRDLMRDVGIASTKKAGSPRTLSRRCAQM